MSEHECIIGLLHISRDEMLVTLSDLLYDINFHMELYNGTKEEYWNYWASRKLPYTLNDYCDRRKSTNLTRFEFCPYCGKKIDWKKIKSEGKEE